jgi:ATP-dependent DNA ligase
LPIREPAREESWTLARGPHSGEDGGMPLGEPVLVGQFEFVEWTEDAHLRHSRFMGLREDKRAENVQRE